MTFIVLFATVFGSFIAMCAGLTFMLWEFNRGFILFSIRFSLVISLAITTILYMGK